MKYLLDTNICIYVIRRKPLRVLARFTQQAVGEIGVSSITVGELAYGVQRSRDVGKNRSALEQFLLPLTILPFDRAAALEYGNVRASLAEQGRPSGPLDTLIGAQALASNLTLVTNNVREFRRIPGLAVENWARECRSRRHLCPGQPGSNVRGVETPPTAGKHRCS